MDKLIKFISSQEDQDKKEAKKESLFDKFVHKLSIYGKRDRIKIVADMETK